MNDMLGCHSCLVSAPPEPAQPAHTTVDRNPEPVTKTTRLSVVITVVGGIGSLRRCLAHLVPQIQGQPIEVLVPYDCSIAWVAALQWEFPQVQFLDMGPLTTKCRPETAAAAHEIYDCRKSHGLSAARGDILALLDDSGAPDPDWCDCLLEAHRMPHEIIGGAVEYEGRGLLAWAVYLQDFSRYQRPLREGPAACLTDINVSYKRRALQAVRRTWDERYNEITVHTALRQMGATLWRQPGIVVRQDRKPGSLWATLRERYCWGRLFGSVRVAELSPVARFIYIVLGPIIPLVLVARMARKAAEAGQRRRFFFALPVLLVVAAAWCVGEVTGYVTRREAR